MHPCASYNIPMNIDERLDVTVRAMQAASDLHYALHFPTLKRSTFSYTKGKKYARVISELGNGQRMVCFFVQMDNGDIWKADGWKKPALNFVRGNVAIDEELSKFIMAKVGPSGYFYHGI